MAKKSKSKSKLKLPKEVAGVKVPKGLRKQAKNLLQIIDTPAGRELAAAGLTLAATALAAKSTDSKAKAVAREVVGKARAAEGDAADLGAILSAAVAEGARRFIQGFEEGREKRAEKAQSERPVRRQAGGEQRPQPDAEGE